MDRKLDQATLRRRKAGRIATTVASVAAVPLLWIWLPTLVKPSVARERIRTARVELGDVEAVVQASGVVMPASEKVLSSPVEARVLRVLRRPGAQVAAGDEILELDVSATRLELDRLVEQLAQKEAEQFQVSLDLERELADLDSRIENLELDIELLRYRLEQQRELHADGLTSESSLRQAEVELRKAEVELRQSRHARDNEIRTSEARTGRLELERSMLNKERDETQRRLELAATRSDSDGVLTWVVAAEGTSVQRGEVIARVADLDSFRIEGTISDAYAARLGAGQDVRVETGGQLLDARLLAIEPAIEDGAMRFHVGLDEPSHPALRQNLRVDLFVVTDTREGVLRVQRGPFARPGNVQQVFVVDGQTATRHEVELGVTGREHYEVLGGLDEGQEIIISTTERYRHAGEVRIK